MLENIIRFSLKNKLLVFLFVGLMAGFGLYSVTHIPIGAVPDITNNQVQVITTSRNLATQDVEQFITYPVELEMANLPGVKELRSVSKFGLSVVTIVFDDKLGTYLPRQLIAEKIKTASEKIPEGFGNPEMGPISTGLGEIYQYILDVKPEFKGKYSPMELRTIQDWVVKRQLSGIPGVVEVNTWGGFLKQYEVSIEPQKLNAMNITVQQVFEALSNNNNISGGAYIEKTNQAYFIRGEGLATNLEDLGNIVVTNRSGIPIKISDIAKTGFGHANRFGAITANGEGEKVLGQVMMLKNANSGAVIAKVKERVDAIQASLPEGVYINGFLERSELIAKTTFTISENLILGCLIVIFIVVLLLGNLRSGLIVASVIPLSLLFALSMMYIFGVDANLMSLGAIDFGIIIDGAVIIVEYISFVLIGKTDQAALLPKGQRQAFIDKITAKSAHKMMRSAVFGQLIIIIVFIPILSLTGVEGKMFRPMGLTFSFALIGAMILCFTYVPAVSALILGRNKHNPDNISNKLMNAIIRLYTPTIKWALNHKKAVLVIAFTFLTGAGVLFSTMGGEFVPTLDEGDFVIQPVLKTGTSLSKTIEITTMIEKILLKFPEVAQVVSRIGAAEIPTDPMSMEESDIIIKLNPIKTWTSAKTKDELADKFTESLTAQIPGIEYEFTQPIEMRFNELITGVRADLAIKIFGEDLNILSNQAQKIKKLIEHVPGASDIIVEKVEGLPQMSVVYNRSLIAKYGLNIKDINDVLSTAFAGKISGNIFEGEKRFDIVIRFDQASRTDLNDVKDIFIPLPSGGQIPIDQVAEITYSSGPAKISRDNTQRRIVVGVNVRNRDLESVVKDVQELIVKNIELPTGYSVSYGGQFENLRSARSRLMIAVPIALLLIFVMLYFAFQSAKDALLIFTAIPLSAIGGILLLWARDLPFSISAGVGFIALFGIAVLNGIVLIEHFKELKEHAFQNINELIITGTKQRLRPVLLTASAAALGFLPMAISTNAGAEVQRPLATVVIGGLITATLLTLIVLPVLYAIFDQKRNKMVKSIKSIPILAVLIAAPFSGFTQKKILNVDEAVEIALNNNSGIKANQLTTRQANEKILTAFNPDKTVLYFNYDENNLPLLESSGPLRVFGIQQQISLPAKYNKRKKLFQAESEIAAGSEAVYKLALEKEVRKSYLSIQYLQAIQANLAFVDSIFSDFAVIALKKHLAGESSIIEKMTAEAKSRQIKTEMAQLEFTLHNHYKSLLAIMQVTNQEFTIPMNNMMDTLQLSRLPQQSDFVTQLFSARQKVADMNYEVEKSNLFPDIQLQIFRGSSFGTGSLWGFQAGLAVPLFAKSGKAAIQVAKTETEIISQINDFKMLQLKTKLENLMTDIERKRIPITYYQTNNKEFADQLVKISFSAYTNGDTDYLHYLQALEVANQIKRQYIEDVYQYNLSIIEINFVTPEY
ncbi:MAG: CusA/CzcA family heavy metal efflux RND transporter [Saprospiraceae bacterium]|nr:CusA/CzcA family heavy metal efflux RND transporter [Saprospiraceae bacterium]